MEKPTQKLKSTSKEIPEVDEDMAKELWREVQKTADDQKIGHLMPPFSLMDGYQSLEDNCLADSLNRRTMSL